MDNILLVDVNKWKYLPIINQYFLLGCIFSKMIEEGKQILIIDYHEENNSKSFLLNIIDLDSEILSKELGIYLFYKSKINFNLLSVTYGNSNEYIDLTNYIYILFYKKNTLFIPTTINFNEIKGDPIPYEKKKIFIEYSLNDIIFKDNYDEFEGFLNNIIYYDFYNYNKYYDYYSYFTKNTYILPDIIKIIKFHEKYYDYTNSFFNNQNRFLLETRTLGGIPLGGILSKNCHTFSKLGIQKSIKKEKINIINLKIENAYKYKKSKNSSFLMKTKNEYNEIVRDRIDFIDVNLDVEDINEDLDLEFKMNSEECRKVVIDEYVSCIIEDVVEKIINNISKSIIEEKYINCIKKYIHSSDKNIIISNNDTNSVIDFLEKNNYKIYSLENKEHNTNLNTFLLTRFCNNVYIDYSDENDKCIDNISFDYMIRQFLDEKVEQFLIT
jgi:hypothetical protein